MATLRPVLASDHRGAPSPSATTPFLASRDASSARFLTASLTKRFETCRSTVLRDRNSDRAISGLLAPRATSRAISSSRSRTHADRKLDAALQRFDRSPAVNRRERLAAIELYPERLQQQAHLPGRRLGGLELRDAARHLTAARRDECFSVPTKERGPRVWIGVLRVE